MMKLRHKLLGTALGFISIWIQFSLKLNSYALSPETLSNNTTLTEVAEDPKLTADLILIEGLQLFIDGDEQEAKKLCEEAFNIYSNNPQLKNLFDIRLEKGYANVCMGNISEAESHFSIVQATLQVYYYDDCFQNPGIEARFFVSVNDQSVPRIRQNPLKIMHQCMSERPYSEEDRILVKNAEKGWELIRAIKNSSKDLINPFYDISDQLNSLAIRQYNTGELQRAKHNFEQSFYYYQKLRKPVFETQNLVMLAKLSLKNGDYQQASRQYDQAWKFANAIEEESLKASVLNGRSSLENILGNHTDAENLANQALNIASIQGDINTIVESYNNLGIVYVATGRYRDAEFNFKKSLEAIGELSLEENNISSSIISEEIISLLHLSETYRKQNKYEEAIETLELASNSLKIRESSYDQEFILLNLGKIHLDQNQFTNAQLFFEEALELSGRLNRVQSQIQSLYELEKLYNQLGEPSKAEKLATQAANLQKTQISSSFFFDDLIKKGDAEMKNNQYDIATQKYTSALKYALETGNNPLVGQAWQKLGATYFLQGNFQEALTAYKKALMLQVEIGDNKDKLNTYLGLGIIYQRLDQDIIAKQIYEKAIGVATNIKDFSLKGALLYDFAVLEKSNGNVLKSLELIEESILIAESLRTELSDPELRQSYFVTVQKYYSFYINLLMELHQQDSSKAYDQQAFEASERSRARTLLELLTEANTNIREGVDPELLQQEKSLQFQLNEVETQRIKIFSNPNSPEEQKSNIEARRLDLLEQYKSLQVKILITSPKYAALQYPEPLNLEQVQQQILDEDTILLQYSLGREKSFLWLVTKEGYSSYELPAKADIEATAQEFYDLLQSPGFEMETRGWGGNIPINQINTDSARQLSDILLGQVQDKLTKKRLLIVADGALNYIPFASLPILNPADTDGTDPLIPLMNDYEIVNLPSASTLDILRQEPKQQTNRTANIAIFADPVFDPEDKRVNGNASAQQKTSEADRGLSELALNRAAANLDIGDWKRLPGTLKEAKAITALIPNQNDIQFYDFDANLKNATKPELENYDYIHFATHGILDTVNPELSGVVLSLVDQNGAPQNGFLRLHDVFNLKLSAADLVVLSACQTGLGEEVRGEGIVGLTRGFMYAGSPRVLVSLWNVDDDATAEIMTRFYRLMLEDKLTAAQALQQAQLEMQTETQWRSPYYWAAFVLQGEWN